MSVNTTKQFSRDEKYNKSKKITLLGSLGNLLLTIFKFVAGFIGGSQAMLADAVHSLSDFGSDLVVLIGLKIAQKPEDANHPYGHGRAETFSTLIVGLILLILGGNILKDAVSMIISGDYKTPGLIALIAAIVSIAVKEFLYQITVKVAEDLNSSSLKANAWHHRTDALSSVAALVGISGAMIKTEWRILDPIAAILVAILVLKVGMEIALETFSDFMESAADSETIKNIDDAATDNTNVINVHSIKTRKVGSETFVDLHIEVNPQMTVTEGHDTARKVKRRIMESVENIGDVLVHIEPKDHQTTEEQRRLNEQLKNQIVKISESVEGAEDIHDVVINHHMGEISGEVHIGVNPEMNVLCAHSISKEVEERIIEQTILKKMTVHIDPLGFE
jgi:cation diffusion facilitator family transporter